MDILQWAGGDGKLKLTAFAIRAGNGYVATQQLRQPTGNAQPETGSSILPGNRGATLGERVKQPAQLFGFHADAGVHHPGHQGLALTITSNIQRNRTIFREFKRISAQIDDDLAKACRVRGNLFGQGILTDDMKFQPLFPRPGCEESADFVKQFRQINRHYIHIQLIGVDLRVIQDVVNQVQQVTATAHHRFRTGVFLPLGQVGIEQGFAITDNRRQRCANFVAHVGQELAFCFGRIAGQFFFQTFLLPLPLDTLALMALGGVNAGALKMGGIAIGGIHGM